MEEFVNQNCTENKYTFREFLDDRSKGKVNWLNRNYFFLGTVLIVLLNILIHAYVHKKPWEILGIDYHTSSHRSDVFFFGYTFCAFLDSFFHSNWQHTLLNMLCFFIAGIYLERKKGTFLFVLFVAFSSYISAIAMGTNALSIYHAGFSGVNYFIYAIIIFDYVFSFQKHRKNKINTVYGGIVVALIYVAMCFNGGTERVSFSFIIPYDLMYNDYHYSSFLAGIIIGAFTEIIKYFTQKTTLEQINKN